MTPFYDYDSWLKNKLEVASFEVVKWQLGLDRNQVADDYLNSLTVNNIYF